MFRLFFELTLRYYLIKICLFLDVSSKNRCVLRTTEKVEGEILMRIFRLNIAVIRETFVTNITRNPHAIV